MRENQGHGHVQRWRTRWKRLLGSKSLKHHFNSSLLGITQEEVLKTYDEYEL